MKTVILAGGLGSRLGEETAARPKPMVEIGGRPIIWRIMKIYSAYGLNDFIIRLGYKGYMIKEYFSNYFLHMSDMTIDLARNEIETHQNSAEPWRLTLVDTGAETQTGGRLKAIRPYLPACEPFCFTSGDGLAAIDIRVLVAFHKSHGRRATITAVAPPGRFGALELENDQVASFREKPDGVANPSVLDLVAGPETIWERDPLEALAAGGELVAYRHDGFWAAMDTLRDKITLDEMWTRGEAPWKVW
jgi:glucose-1-phosphate cytidylyltransferase